MTGKTYSSRVVTFCMDGSRTVRTQLQNACRSKYERSASEASKLRTCVTCAVPSVSKTARISSRPDQRMCAFLVHLNIPASRLRTMMCRFRSTAHLKRGAEAVAAVGRKPLANSETPTIKHPCDLPNIAKVIYRRPHAARKVPRARTVQHSCWFRQTTTNPRQRKRGWLCERTMGQHPHIAFYARLQCHHTTNANRHQAKRGQCKNTKACRHKVDRRLQHTMRNAKRDVAPCDVHIERIGESGDVYVKYQRIK